MSENITLFNQSLTSIPTKSDAHIGNGCMTYFKGSHHGPLLSHTAGEIIPPRRMLTVLFLDSLRDSSEWSSSNSITNKANLAKTFIRDEHIDYTTKCPAQVTKPVIISMTTNVISRFVR